ncbi:MAG: type II toxin-antitoxin system VapC family toxin [Jatrophihabitantaceae bacterium]
MTLLVDTSVWSLAFRRDTPADVPEVAALARALAGADLVVTAGVVLVELLTGMLPPRVERTLAEQIAPMNLIEPTRDDYLAAAALINECRRLGVQLKTVDAVIAQLAIANDLTLLTTDRDFEHAAEHIPLRLWRAT